MNAARKSDPDTLLISRARIPLEMSATSPLLWKMPDVPLGSPPSTQEQADRVSANWKRWIGTGPESELTGVRSNLVLWVIVMLQLLAQIQHPMYPLNTARCRRRQRYGGGSVAATSTVITRHKFVTGITVGTKCPSRCLHPIFVLHHVLHLQ